ncbi:MAG: hypothetical protein AAGA96_10200 [Verrucomicrobiota bacterium]
MANRFTRQWLLPQLLVATCILAGLAIFGAAKDEARAMKVGLIFEGTFESAALAKKIEGAKRTQLVPYYEWDYGIRAFTEDYWTENQFTWERISDLSKRNAETILDNVEPTIIRDSRGVAEYLIIEDEDPFLTCILLSDTLIDHFNEWLGAQIYAVCIDRHLIYLFPAAGSTIEDYGPALVDEFMRASLPVSLEVLLIDESGVRVFAELQR